MARKAKSKAAQSRTGGFSIFALGLIVGCVGTALTLGVFQDRPSDIGSGIGQLLQSGGSENKSEENPIASSITEQAAKVVTYKFHDLLLEDEYVLPDPVTAPEPKQSSEPAEVASSANVTAPEQPPAPAPAQPEPALAGGTYVLQVGSYKSFKDADNQKASLALSGLASFIQKVTIEELGEFYRVRLGPFESIEAMQSVNSTLKQQGIKAVRFRVKTEG